jgi:protein involved in polysaccharide export with SLBB domain
VREKRRECKFELQDNLRIKDLVLMAGGLTDDASQETMELYRTDQNTRQLVLTHLNLSKAMEGAESDNIPLLEHDRVVVHSKSESVPEHYVQLTGELNRPGKYPYATNMTVRDAIFAAGNLTEAAYLDEVEVASHSVQDGKLSLINFTKVDLRKVLAGDPSHNLQLKPYDSIFVKRVQNWKTENFIELRGEFVYPGRYIIKDGERLSSVIARAGGFSDKSYLRGAIFTRASLRNMQQKQLDDLADTLESTLISKSLASSQTSLSPEDAAQKRAVLDQQKMLLSKLRSTKALGRLAIKISSVETLVGSSSDLQLEDGDILELPQKQSSVSVLGSVFNQNSFIYDSSANISSYINLAGGVNKEADKDSIFILKADGTAESKYHAGWGFYSIKPEPGDTIVVPQEYDKVAWLKDLKDITQILEQVAITTGVVLKLFP